MHSICRAILMNRPSYKHFSCAFLRHFSDDISVTNGKNHSRSQALDIVPSSTCETEGLSLDIQQILEENLDECLLPSQRIKAQKFNILKAASATKTTPALFRLYSDCSSLLENEHYVKIMERLSCFVTDGIVEAKPLHEMPQFQSRCYTVYKLSRTMEVSELVTLVKSFSKLQVNVNSKLFLAVLQGIRHNVNYLDVQEIVFLNYLLGTLPKNKLTEALLQALPLVLQNLLCEQPVVNHLSLKELSLLLQLCVQEEIVQINIVLEEINKRRQVITSQDALKFLWTLYEMSSRKEFLNSFTVDFHVVRDILAKDCLAKMSADIENLSPKQIQTTLSLMRKYIFNITHREVNEKFFDGAISCAVNSQWDAVLTAQLIEVLVKLSYVSDELVVYVINHMRESPDAMNLPAFSAASLISALVNSSLEEQVIHDVVTQLFNCSKLKDFKTLPEQPLLRVAEDLVSIGYVHDELLDFLLDPETLKVHWEATKEVDEGIKYFQLLHIQQFLTLVKKSTKQFPVEYLDVAQKRKKEVHSKQDLADTLSNIFGGDTYFKSRVFSDNYLYMDHLVVMSDDGSVLEVGSDDCRPAAETLAPFQRIAVQIIRPSWICRPKDTLRSYKRLEKLLLEKEGYRIIEVHHSILQISDLQEKSLEVKKSLRCAGIKLSD